jgi:hypothetical protein
MKIFVVSVFVLCTALPFAFYVCSSAANDKAVPAPAIKAFGRLLITIFVLALAAFGPDVDWSNAFRPIAWIIAKR